VIAALIVLVATVVSFLLGAKYGVYLVKEQIRDIEAKGYTVVAIKPGMLRDNVRVREATPEDLN
jgi:hypothetical protein